MDYSFEVNGPVTVKARLGRGHFEIRTTEESVARVSLGGPDAHLASVVCEHGQLTLEAPRRTSGFSGEASKVHAEVTVPAGSTLAVHTVSAGVITAGAFASASVTTSSGDVALDCAEGMIDIDTGSGDVVVREARGELDIRTGSGDVRVIEAQGPVRINCGSGDVELLETRGPTAIKTGSGDVRVREAIADLGLLTSSGDVVVDAFTSGRLHAQGASGDLAIGIPVGTPVWADVNSRSGAVVSQLRAVGEPAADQPYVELLATTVSGDILLREAEGNRHA